jgi:ribosomal protein S18 acetylase RimI-like enzyme
VYTIRPFHLSDLTSLYRICLETLFGGAEAIAGFTDPDLLGHFYAGPYAILEPELCFILTRDGAPAGYILGTADSQAFRARGEREWFPVLREHYPLRPAADRSRDAGMIRLLHRGHSAAVEWADEYPAHLHIDLLRVAQGAGQGRKLMERFLETLRSRAVPGVHLGVGRRNAVAVAFYERIGFQILLETDGTITYGMRL